MRVVRFLAAGSAVILAGLQGGGAVDASSPPSEPTPVATTPAATTADGPAATGGPGVPPDARFDYETAIRERVTVTNGLDDDHDGQPDRFTLDIVRPETDEPVPVLLIQSPYWDGLGRGREHETKGRAGSTVVTMPLFYDNWFVPRGYAFVALDVAGTGEGGGCEDNFGAASLGAATAALDWLAGRGPALDPAGAPVQATWSAGRVAMLGKSYDGGMAIAAAATGHPALRAIVPIAGVSASLERLTAGGLLDGLVPEADWYAGRCARWAESFLAGWGDGFSYSDFWRERDPTTDMSRWTAATLVVNGVQDLNVATSQAALLWEALGEHAVPRFLWLHQGAHDDPFDIRRAEWVATLSAFLDHFVRGDANGFAATSAVTVQEPDGRWTERADWPPPASATTWAWATDRRLVPFTGAPAADPLAPIGQVARDAQDRPAPEFEGYVDFWLGTIDAARPYRLVVASDPLREPLTIAGAPTITASFRQTGARYGIMAALVDLGPAERPDLEAGVLGGGLESRATESCYGASSRTDDACYFDADPALVATELGLIAAGGSGIERPTFRDPVVAVPDGEWVEATIGLGWANATIPAGHRLGVVFLANSLVGPDVLTTRTVEVGSDLRVELPVPSG